LPQPSRLAGQLPCQTLHRVPQQSGCAGNAQGSSGSASCLPCFAGSATDALHSSGATSRAACPTGRNSPQPTQVCAVCSAGSTTNTLGQPGGQNCTACPAGKSSMHSPLMCAACPVGQYQSQAASTMCASCTSGSVTNTLTAHCERSWGRRLSLSRPHMYAVCRWNNFSPSLLGLARIVSKDSASMPFTVTDSTSCVPCVK
jgi:hypothetical protein